LDDRVKWTRAVHHVRELGDKCAELAGKPPSLFPLRVVQLWAFGDILDAPRDLDWVQVALAVDLPAEDVPWLSEPVGAEHWANATRMSKNPLAAWWRSAHAPIWNHRVERPALVWDIDSGVAEETIAAIQDGRAEEVRSAAPTPDELGNRLDDELAGCLKALHQRTQLYEERRWSPGKLTPVADALWRSSDGYLDVLDAVTRS
jgi:hypothetical protein